ncbi:MAG: delta-60 repeat domain-containing protein [Bdellovibrionales bacterium]
MIAGEYTPMAEIPAQMTQLMLPCMPTTRFISGRPFTRTGTQLGPCSGGGVIINSTTGQSVQALSTITKIRGSVSAALPDGEGGYIAGNFETVGHVARNNIARINADGSVHPFNQM